MGGTAVGFAAVALAPQRSIRHPVVEEWQRRSRLLTGPVWVLDAVLLTGGGHLEELAIASIAGTSPSPTAGS
jgi:hypothetical protein